MLARIFSTAIAGLVLVANSANADFMPENELWREDGLLRSQNLTQDQFNEVINEAELMFGPIIKTMGGTLKVNRLWNDSTVNASAIQFGAKWEVNMYGGLARRPEVTRDGFALVLCHEIGHHIGGYPFSSTWAANEGASDYFATLACGRLLWSDEAETNETYAEDVEEIPKALCDNAWTETNDRNLCYRMTAAGKSLANLLSALGGTKANWNTPDKNVVKKTYHAHPAGQCRLDTYAAGALCDKSWDFKIIPAKDLGRQANTKEGELAATKYTCNQHAGATFGYRPLCWFKPFVAAEVKKPFE